MFALLPVLQRFVVCPGSTSGIEQAFSKFKRLMGEQWHGSAEAEERRLVLRLKAADTPQLPWQLLRAARRIWVAASDQPGGQAHCAALRWASKKPCDSGKLLREAAAAPCSAAAWLRKRSRDVAAAATALTPTSRTAGPERSSAQALMDAPEAWTAAHEKEAERQRKVRIDRACAAVLEGTANRSCLRAVGASSQALDDFRKREENRQCGLEVQWRRKASAQALPEKVELHGKRLFIDDGARVACGLEARWCAAKVPCWRDGSADRAVAQVFVVWTPASRETGTRPSRPWSVGCSAPLDLYWRLGNGAVALQLHPALSMPRFTRVRGTSSSSTGPWWTSCRKSGRWGAVRRQGPRKATVAWFTDTPDQRERFLERARRRDKDHASEW